MRPKGPAPNQFRSIEPDAERQSTGEVGAVAVEASAAEDRHVETFSQTKACPASDFAGRLITKDRRLLPIIVSAHCDTITLHGHWLRLRLPTYHATGLPPSFQRICDARGHRAWLARTL